MSTVHRPPILFVITGPSGSGKGTVIRHLLETYEDLEQVVTYTTRCPREGEVDGVHYRFIDEEVFQRLRREGEIFEYERVYDDYYYASPANVLHRGIDRIIEVDYKGHRKFRAHYENTVSIFLLPPSLDTLAARIRRRSPEDNMEARLENAREQIHHAGEYDYLLVNDVLETTLARARAIVTTERLRAERPRLLGQWEIPDAHP